MSSVTKFLIGFPVLLVLAVGFVLNVRSISAALKPGAVQRVDSLANDIVRKQHLSPLQPWAIETMERFLAGQLRPSGGCKYYPFSRFKLATNEVPQFIRDEWADEPEVSIVTTTNGQPQCVAISWYLHGVLIGSTNFVKTVRKQFDPSEGIWYLKPAKPGVYVYHLYK